MVCVLMCDQSHPTRSTWVVPRTVTPLPSEAFAPASTSPAVVARCDWQWALMVSPPMTLTVVRKQYQPLGLSTCTTEPPATLTPGLTRASAGVCVTSVSAVSGPMPNTLTEVDSVLYEGFFPKGCLPQAFRQLATELSTSSAATADTNVLAPSNRPINHCLCVC